MFLLNYNILYEIIKYIDIYTYVKLICSSKKTHNDLFNNQIHKLLYKKYVYYNDIIINHHLSNNKRLNNNKNKHKQTKIKPYNMNKTNLNNFKNNWLQINDATNTYNLRNINGNDMNESSIIVDEINYWNIIKNNIIKNDEYNKIITNFTKQNKLLNKLSQENSIFFNIVKTNSYHERDNRSDINEIERNIRVKYNNYMINYINKNYIDIKNLNQYLSFSNDYTCKLIQNYKIWRNPYLSPKIIKKYINDIYSDLRARSSNFKEEYILHTLCILLNHINLNNNDIIELLNYYTNTNILNDTNTNTNNNGLNILQQINMQYYNQYDTEYQKICLLYIIFILMNRIKNINNDVINNILDIIEDISNKCHYTDDDNNSLLGNACKELIPTIKHYKYTNIIKKLYSPSNEFHNILFILSLFCLDKLSNLDKKQEEKIIDIIDKLIIKFYNNGISSIVCYNLLFLYKLSNCINNKSNKIYNYSNDFCYKINNARKIFDFSLSKSLILQTDALPTIDPSCNCYITKDYSKLINDNNSNCYITNDYSKFINYNNSNIGLDYINNLIPKLLNKITGLLMLIDNRNILNNLLSYNFNENMFLTISYKYEINNDINYSNYITNIKNILINELSSRNLENINSNNTFPSFSKQLYNLGVGTESHIIDDDEDIYTKYV